MDGVIASAEANPTNHKYKFSSASVGLALANAKYNRNIYEI